MTTDTVQHEKQPPQSGDSLIPPVAKRMDFLRSFHGDEFHDPYEWMRDKDSPELQQYVVAQNAYEQGRNEHLHSLSSTLFDELKSRVRETDMSVPTRMDGYWYFVRTQEGQQYAVQCRIPVQDENDWIPPHINEHGEPGSMPGEEIVFDTNHEAAGHSFFRLGGMDLSKDGHWLLYGVDTTGDERYDYRIRNLNDGSELPEVLPSIGGACLTPDGQWIFYAKLDEAWRPYAVWRHHVGTAIEHDVEVFHEDDERFWVGVGLSFDERQIVIGTGSKTSSEVLMLPTATPQGVFRPFIARQDDIEYDVSFASFENAGEHGEDIPLAIVYHNAANPNFEVDIIDMRRHDPPFTLGEGVCIASGSPYGCEYGDRSEPGASTKPVDTPYVNASNPNILQGVRGLGIEGIALHRHFVTLAYRANSLPHVAFMTKDQAAADFIAGRPWQFRELAPRDETAVGAPSHLYALGTSGNASYEAPRIRYSFSSYTKPGELHEIDPKTGEDTLLKRAQVLGDFDANRYAERRIWVNARDGARIPVSLVWRSDALPWLADALHDGDGISAVRTRSAPSPLGGTVSQKAPSANVALTKDAMESKDDMAPKDAASCEEPAASRITAGDAAKGNAACGCACDYPAAPMFITGYGAYEISSDPGFSVGRISLLDRGVLYAVPHIRGGGEMGRAWYEQGRRLAKKHSFEDFVDATVALQDAGYADPSRTVANGGSAGGLLMGAIANMAPERYAGIEADVPFVDALTSILDPNLPLTVTEWDEWGDPLHDDRVYRYMKSYTPYENAPSDEHPAKVFPKIFITTSMNDTRVLYVEPLKWLARLQSAGVDAMARIEIEAGHGGTSGRYKQWQEVSEENAWCLDVMQATQIVNFK